MAKYPRSLTDGEIVLLKSVFGNGLNYEDIRIDEGGIAATETRRAIAITHYDIMRFPKPLEDFSHSKTEDRAWLVHEATHVWQWQQYGTDTYEKASQLWLSEGFDYDAGYKFSLSDKFSEMSFEAQARAIEDRYLVSQSKPPRDETDWQSDQPVPPLSAYDILLQPFDAQNAKGPPPHRKHLNRWDRDGEGGGGFSEENSSEAIADGLDDAIDEEQEQLRHRLQGIMAILDAIDEDDLPVDRDVIDGFLDDLDAQLDDLDTRTGKDLLDRLRILVGRLNDWQNYLQNRLDEGAIPDDDTLSPISSDDPSNDWREDEEEAEEWDEQPPVSFQEEEPEPEPEYVWLDPDPRSGGDDCD